MKSTSDIIIPPGHPAGQPDLIRETSAFWSEHYGREVSAEEAREMIANVTGFFSILLEWEKQARVIPHDIDGGMES